MSDYNIEITEISEYKISIDTSLIQNENNVEITIPGPNNVDIINNNILSVNDLPQGYPLSWTVGDLPISRVSGLNIVGGSGIDVINNSGIFTVSVTDDFGLTNEEVDDRVANLLIPGQYINLNYDDNLNTLTINASGLQPSGDYTLVGHSHEISDINGLQNALDNKQPSGIYASGIHYHTTSDITDFDTSVSGLLQVKNIVTSSGINSSISSGIYTLSLDSHASNHLPSGSDQLFNQSLNTNNDVIFHGLYLDSDLEVGGDVRVANIYDGQLWYSYGNPQTLTGLAIGVSGQVLSVNNSGTHPEWKTLGSAAYANSGDFALINHTHLSSDITDFNSSVSGLIPPSNFTSLSGISGIIVTNSGTNYFVGLNDPTIQLVDITDLGSAAQTFLLTSSSINLSSLMIDKTGSGVLVFNDSPVFSGIPTVPTAPSGTNTSQIANTAFVRTEISNLVDSAPLVLDTLNELAAALGDDPNFATTIASGLGQKANLSGAIFTGSVTIPSGTGNFNNLLVNNIPVSISGHSHTSSDITNFNSSVSGLLPSTIGSGYVNSSFNNNIYTISVSGLQPSGNYASGIHYHTSSDITDFHASVSGLLPITDIIGGTNIAISNSGSVYTVSVSGQLGLTAEQVDDRVNNLLVAGTGITLDYNDNSDTLTINTSGLQPSGNYSLVGHSHVSSDITNFNTSVSGLLTPYAQLNSPNFSGVPTVPTATSGTNTNQIASTAFVRTEIGYLVDSAPAVLDTLNELAAALGDDPNFATTIASGLAQKSNIGHSHVSSDITNFNSSVSGLLPVVNISAGSGIGISSLSGDFTVSVTGNFGLTSEEVDDRVSNLLVPGSYISLDYNDNLNTLTINTSGLQPSGNYSVVGHLHEISDVNGLQIALDSKQPSGIYASGIHYHISSDITDFSSSVSGLLPSITGTGFVNSNFNNNTYTISVTGLQPTGNYSLVGHSHISTDITDFNNAVSGLLPVKDITAGTGISVSSLSGIYTISSTVSGVQEAASIVTTVFNKTASTINKGSVVYINGGQGDQPTIQLAIAANELGSSKTYGIVQSNIPTMSLGKVVVAGALTGFNTDQYNPTAPHGDVNGVTLWLSPTVSGAMTTSKPSAPYHMVSVGTIVRTHQNEGVIEVRIQNGYELEELHNVAISGVTNGQFLQYNSGSGLWVPSSSGNFNTLQVNGTGVSISGHTHIASNITDFNSSVIGLLPTISNSGDNRLLTSTGSSVGINAENNLTFDGSTFNVDGNLIFDSFTESVIAIGSSNSGVVVSIGGGTVQTCTLTNNCTFTMPATTAGKSFTMFLNTGSGNYTASFSGVLWSDSAPPTITTAASKVDILSFISDGTYWYGSYSQNYG